MLLFNRLGYVPYSSSELSFRIDSKVIRIVDKIKYLVVITGQSVKI